MICNGKDHDAAIFRAIEERERKVLKKDTARTGGRRRPGEWKGERARSRFLDCQSKTCPQAILGHIVESDFGEKLAPPAATKRARFTR